MNTTPSTTPPTWTNRIEPPPARDVWKAIFRGMRGRCPNCGEGKIFCRFLKIADRCPACGESLHHHRADDFPAYVVIVIVGHIVVPLVLMAETNYAWPYALHLAVWLPLTLALSVGLLTPVKGAIVGLQWGFRMHGFGDPEAPELAH
jgi:uncharacterized protein (DUF983 family)